MKRRLIIRNFELSKAIIPNSFTALNAFSGFVSIVLSSQGHFLWAIAFIGVAALFDTLDGLMARLVKTSSEFGVELDSLSDVISFGAAPSFLVYSVVLHEYDLIGIIVSSFIMVFGTFRLARFNIQIVDLDTKGDFKGVPIPLAALTIASYLFTFISSDNALEAPYTWLTIPLIILLSLLMVSRIRYNSLPKPGRGNIKKSLTYFGVVAALVAVVAITKGEALFFIFFSIILFGIFRYIYVHLFVRRKKRTKNISK